MPASPFSKVEKRFCYRCSRTRQWRSARANPGSDAHRLPTRREGRKCGCRSSAVFPAFTVETSLIFCPMIYYHYIFYSAYHFFCRMNSRDMPGVKATLLVGFIMLMNSMLALNALLSWLGYNTAHVISQPIAKVLLVVTQLILWGGNYWLFWRGGRWPVVLQHFEENTSSFHRGLARVLTGWFFLLPVALFIYNAVRSAYAMPV